MSGTASPAGGGTPSGMGEPRCQEQLAAISIAVAAITTKVRSQRTPVTPRAVSCSEVGASSACVATPPAPLASGDTVLLTTDGRFIVPRIRNVAPADAALAP